MFKESCIFIYMNSYVKSFSEYLNDELNYSEKTVKTYLEALKEFENFLNTHHYAFLSIKKEEANQYKAFLISKGFESKTASLYLSAVRSFYRYLVEIKTISSNPFAAIRNPKVIKKLPNFLNQSESEILFTEEKPCNDLEFRNEFIIEFLYATGLRVSEACNIKLSDIYYLKRKLK